MSNYTGNKFTPENNSSWGAVYDLIKEKTTILDIGCSSGNFGEVLSNKKDCVVDGIDLDNDDVSKAKQKLRNAWCADVEKSDITKITRSRYDYILLLDVVEHLVSPVDVLKKLQSLLKNDGQVIISVPNMAHISARLELMKGNFAYKQTGLLDNTHLHFYTEKFLKDIVQSANYDITTASLTSITYPKALLSQKLEEVGLQSSEKFSEAIHNTRGDVYQFIWVLKPNKNKQAQKVIKFPKRHDHERHFIEIDNVIKEQRDHIKFLEESIVHKDNHIHNLENRLSSITLSRTWRIGSKIARVLRFLKPIQRG